MVAVLAGGHEHMPAIEAGTAVVAGVVYYSRHFTSGLGCVEQRQDGIYGPRAEGEGLMRIRPKKEQEQRR